MASQACQQTEDISWAAGRVALVTGAAVRVGKAISNTLHRQGFKIAVHYSQSKKEAESFVAELNSKRAGSAFVIQADLSTDIVETSRRLVAAVVDKCGKLDLLVNNSAVYYTTPISETTEEQWDKLMNLNAKAPYFLIQAAAPHLKKTRGSVVNVADILGERPDPPYNVYCCSKASLLMITKSLALELAPEVRVNSVLPGAAIFPKGADEKEKQKWIAKTPLGSSKDGYEVADAVLFLASPSASFITGSGISPSGGHSIAL